MLTIQGKFADATVMTDNIEQHCIEQIQHIVDTEEFAGSKIVLMPDCHAGKGCCVGFTQTVTDKICPSLVGVDIGCGMLTLELADDVSTDEFLDACRAVPVGHSIHRQAQVDVSELLGHLHADVSERFEYLQKSVGSLGSGNHFIELNVSEKTGAKYVVIHSGSRHLGVMVCQYWLSRASGEGDLKFLHGEDATMYLEDMALTQEYAEINRAMIAQELGFSVLSQWETVHNYVHTCSETGEVILRKGSISALRGERCLIPLNMRDGSLVCVGLGNPDWNYSAPHGAGRAVSRTQARAMFQLSDYQASMQGIASVSVCAKTIDECPFAYKDATEIETLIDGHCVEVVDHLRVLANHKGF